MELGTSILGFVTIALCFLPFLWMGNARKKKEKKLLNNLRSLADQQSCTITDFDLGPDLAIGIDAENGWVFFYKKKEDALIQESLSFSSIKKCRIHSQKRNVKIKNSSKTVIDQLELVFEPAEESAGRKRWEMYNADENFQLNGELQLTQKWEALINESL